jgi:DNA-binding cell septation regulator SpoVG
MYTNKKGIETYPDEVYPITKEAREHLETEVLKEHNKEVEMAKLKNPPNTDVDSAGAKLADLPKEIVVEGT